MSTTATSAKLHPAQAIAIRDAEDEVTKANAALERAKEDREKVRARYRHLFPDDGGELRAAGVNVKVTQVAGRLTFSLSNYLKRHRATKAMQLHMKTGEPYDLWTVTTVAAPAE